MSSEYVNKILRYQISKSNMSRADTGEETGRQTDGRTVRH